MEKLLNNPLSTISQVWVKDKNELVDIIDFKTGIVMTMQGNVYPLNEIILTL